MKHEPTREASRTYARFRVVLVDDHRLMREGLRRILDTESDFEIVGETDEGHQALTLVRSTQPHLAIVDLNLPGLSGVNLVRRLRQERPETAVLVLSMHAEELYAMRAMKAGAQGYICKDAAPEELVAAVRKVAGGGCYLSRPMAERVVLSLVRQEEGPPHERLTDREFEILRLISVGKRPTEIAQLLHLSVKTVSTHKSRILQKMYVDSTAGLILYAVQHRLFSETHDRGPEFPEIAARDSVHTLEF